MLQYHDHCNSSRKHHNELGRVADDQFSKVNFKFLSPVLSWNLHFGGQGWGSGGGGDGNDQFSKVNFKFLQVQSWAEISISGGWGGGVGDNQLLCLKLPLHWVGLSINKWFLYGEPQKRTNSTVFDWQMRSAVLLFLMLQMWSPCVCIDQCDLFITITKTNFRPPFTEMPLCFHWYMYFSKQMEIGVSTETLKHFNLGFVVVSVGAMTSIDFLYYLYTSANYLNFAFSIFNHLGCTREEKD